MLRKYHLYVVGICVVIALGATGCSAGINAETMADNPVTAEVNRGEITMNDTMVAKSVTEAVENMEENQLETPQSIRIYGPVTRTEDKRLLIDDQPSMNTSGGVILNMVDSATYILNAMTGFSIVLEDVKDESITYAYMGSAITIGFPPVINVVMIFISLPAGAKVPGYVEVKPMVTDVATSEFVLATMDGTEFILAEDRSIFPYFIRDIMTLDGLMQGKKCVVWSDDENTASKIVLSAK